MLRAASPRGITWDPLDFPDNSDSLELLTGKAPPGLFPMLDEECCVIQGSDAAFCSKVPWAGERFETPKTIKICAQFCLFDFAPKLLTSLTGRGMDRMVCQTPRILVSHLELSTLLLQYQSARSTNTAQAGERGC